MATRLVSACVAIALALSVTPTVAVASRFSAERLADRYSPIVASATRTARW